MTALPEVRVLCEGWLVREGARVVDASSTVTAIEAETGTILVDTGSASCVSQLTSAMSAAEMRPEDVRHVVNTHLHTDHCGANDLFKDAVFYAHEMENPPVGARRVRDELSLSRGVRLLHTPGHTRGSISVLVESDRRYAICGDALPTRANYESHTPPAVHIDRGLALRSMDMLLGWAQAVIPGHDRLFEVVAKK